MKTTLLTALASGRGRTASAAQTARRFPAITQLILALTLAASVLPLLGAAAIAQDLTFSLRFAYRCSAKPAVPGCDAVTEQATFTTLQAPARGPVDLTAENGGKGVLSTFWLIDRRDSSDMVIACADGSALIFDTSKLFTQKADYFSCGKVTITGANGLNLVLSPAADGRGGVQGSTPAGWVNGSYRFMARHIETLISQEFVTLPLITIPIQNRWDFCTFSGLEVLASGAPSPAGCLLHPGYNDGNPWTLEALSPGYARCHAVCMSHLPE
jgi:hypothetical protein